MRAPNASSIRACALASLWGAAACTAVVDDDNPFATVGMTGATSTATSDGTASGDATSGEGDTEPDGSGSTGPEPGTTDEGTTTLDDTAADECNPPCDPLVAVCEAGQCVPPGPPLPGQVVLTELMPNPAAVTDDDGEWIELVNVGTDPVDLEGCVLYGEDGDEDVVNTDAPLVVPPGGLVVLAKVVDAGLNGGVPGVAYGFGTSFSLTNTGDVVRLECDGAVIDEVTYLETWPFAAGVAMQLSSASIDATANDAAGSWCAATAAYGSGDLGTPGQANAGC